VLQLESFSAAAPRLAAGARIFAAFALNGVQLHVFTHQN
jgi:hypothetical protein